MTERWEPRRFRWGMRQVILFLIIMGVIVVVAGIAIIDALRNAFVNERGPAEATAQTYMSAMIDDDIAGAYALTCRPIHDKMTVAEFDTYQDRRDQVTDFSLTGFSVRTGSGGTNAMVAMTVDLTDGRRYEQRLTLVKEDGDWRVCE